MAAIRPVVPAAAVLLALLFLFGVTLPEGSVTTYAAASDAAAVAGRAAGLALVAAGASAFLAGRSRSAGVLAMAAGLAWWAPDVVGWEDASAPARSIAAVAAPFFLPLVLHLVLGRPRALVGGAYAAAAVTSLAVAAFRDPLADLDCWSNCTDNVFLVDERHDLAVALGRLWLVAAVALGVTLAVMATARSARARRAVRPLLAAGALTGAADATYAAALLIQPAEDPQRAGFAAIYLARSAGAIALAAGLTWATLDTWRRHNAVARLSAQLGESPQPGTLAAVLARSLGDPQLQVGYWLPDERRHVDASGRTLALPSPGGPRATTRIARAAEPVAVVVHDSALLDGPALEREIGAAARLAVDNERLQAAVLAQLADLRDSRARIVESADAERRRLERDLHDGAQQRLLALSYELRIARGKTQDPELAALLGDAVDRAGEALADLRELAHGIHPAILTEAGLAAALATLADTAPLAVEILEVTTERHPHPVEAAAYVAVAWAIEDAAARGATFVGVSAARNGHRQLIVEIGDDGVRRGAPALYVADRIAALSGRLESGAQTLVVELPCA